MRVRRLYSLSKSDRRLFESVRLFIDGRLADRKILEWALSINSDRFVERLAVQIEVDHRADSHSSPWSDAWRLLMESWDLGDLPDKDRKSTRLKSSHLCAS